MFFLALVAATSVAGIANAESNWHPLGSQFDGAYAAAKQGEGVALSAFPPGNVFTFGELHAGLGATGVAVLVRTTGCIDFLSHRTGKVGIETVCPVTTDPNGKVTAVRLLSTGEVFTLLR